MKKNLIKGLAVIALAVVAVLTISLTSVEAKSVYNEYALDTYSEDYDLSQNYTLEEMLNYALLDEFMAKAEYEAIIATFGDVMPFVRIVEAEQTHISLLLPLFESYGFEIPKDNSLEYVVIPESITSALATGVEAEEANIAMYELFLSQSDLPEDVRVVFETLKNASEHHLVAFSQDRYSYMGQDMMNQFKNQFRNAFQGSKGNHNGQDSNNQNRGDSYNGTRGNNGECINN